MGRHLRVANATQTQINCCPVSLPSLRFSGAARKQIAIRLHKNETRPEYATRAAVATRKPKMEALSLYIYTQGA